MTEDSERGDGPLNGLYRPSLDRRTFLKSTATTALGAGLASQPAAAATTYTVAQKTGEFTRLTGAPDYEIGVDRGFYVWVTDDTLHVRWTGNTDTTDNVHVVSYEVETDGTFGTPTRVKWEDTETLKATDTRLSGRGAVGPGHDGFDVPLSNATELRFDLRFSDPITQDTWQSLSDSEQQDTVANTSTFADPSVVHLGGDEQTPDAIPFTVTTGTAFQVTALSGDQPVEEFYGGSSEYTSTSLEREETSHLFLYDGPNGLSLVVIHDAPTDGEDGAVSFDFTGLPTGEGQWVVQDDSGDFDSATDTSVDWRWPVYGNKDGGAWRGGLDDGLEVTIDPMFNEDARRSPQYGEITAWQFLSGNAASPDRFTLDMNAPVTITTGDATQPDNGVNLGPLTDQKRTLISDIRTAAEPAIGPTEAQNRVDVRAASLLSDIKNDAFGVTDSQYVEALERMNAAETVTLAATEQVSGDESPTNTVIRDLYSLITGAAVELLPEFLEGIVGSVVKSLADDVITKIDDMAGAFGGRGIIPDSVMNQIDDVLSRLKIQQSDTVGEWVEDNPKTAEDVAKTAGGGAIGEAKDLGEGAIAALDDNRSVQDQLEELYFEGYYFKSDWPDVHIPSPDEIEIPDVNYRYDVPDEDLPDYLQGSVPDKITLNVDTKDIQLPESGGLQRATDLLEQLAEIATPSGVDATIDERMAFLEENLNALAEQDDALRDDLGTQLSNGISDVGDLVTWLIGFIEDYVQKGLSIASDLTTVLMVVCVVLAAVLVVTGIGTIGLLTIAGFLATFATVLGVLNLTMDYVQIAAGQGSLAFTNFVHHAGTYGLVETDLTGVSR